MLYDIDIVFNPFFFKVNRREAKYFAPSLIFRKLWNWGSNSMIFSTLSVASISKVFKPNEAGLIDSGPSLSIILGIEVWIVVVRRNHSSMLRNCQETWNWNVSCPAAPTSPPYFLCPFSCPRDTSACCRLGVYCGEECRNTIPGNYSYVHSCHPVQNPRSHPSIPVVMSHTFSFSCLQVTVKK